MKIDKIKDELKSMGDPERARHSLGFFKTGPGEYGEGDVFLGIKDVNPGNFTPFVRGDFNSILTTASFVFISSAVNRSFR